MSKLAFHPLADVLPMIEGGEFAELVASIKQNGLRDPITMLGELILDGRNRYLACLEAGVEPRFAEFSGPDPLMFVLDKNLRRRQLNSGQRAMAVEKYATLAKGVHRDSNAGQPAFTVPELAALAGVNKSTVSDAKTVRANGTQEEIASVVNGTALVTPVAREVRARRDAKPTRRPRTPAGQRIVIPEGTKLSELVSDGIKLEEQTHETAKSAAKKLGLGHAAYGVTRDAILLSRRDDLSLKDAEAVAQALREIDETLQVRKARRLIAPIAKRVWGHKGHRMTGTDARRSKQFDNAISFLLHTCENAVEMRIPQITQAQVHAATKQLTAAAVSLKKLRQRIREVKNG